MQRNGGAKAKRWRGMTTTTTTYNFESLSVLFLSKCFLTETAFLMRW